MNADWAPGGRQPSDQTNRFGLWVRRKTEVYTVTIEYIQSGKAVPTKVCLRVTGKDSDIADVTCCGRQFQTRAVATGKAWSPMADNHIRRTVSDSEEAEHRQASKSASQLSSSARKVWTTLNTYSVSQKKYPPKTFCDISFLYWSVLVDNPPTVRHRLSQCCVYGYLTTVTLSNHNQFQQFYSAITKNECKNMASIYLLKTFHVGLMTSRMLHCLRTTF